MIRPVLADVSTAVGPRRTVDAPGLVPALTIIAHPQAHRAGERLVLDGVALGGEVAVSRNAADFVRPGHALGAPLDDPFVSRRPIRFAPGSGGGVRVIVEPGGTPVVGVPASEGGVELTAEQLAAGVVLELAERVVVLLHLHDRTVGDARDGLGMLGDGAGIRRVRLAIERLADLSVPVLIRGETGTGKELVARAIHAGSPHRDGPFVSVNLGAIPRELAAAELFGAVRGAYTGATRDRDGLFRAAHGGSLFLDEIGEAAPEVQVMLLRVLESGELYPVGGDKPVRSHARLIAATDAQLERQIERGQFKAPLLHRLAGYEIRLPALRERREDLGVLFHHFVREELEAIGEAGRLVAADAYARPWLSSAIAARLVRHAWPGNIRELRNLARQLAIGSRGHAQLELDPQLAANLPAAAPSAPGVQEAGAVARRRAVEVSEGELVEALRACGWDLKAAADRLRISRPSIYDLIDRYPSIPTAGSLSADEIHRCWTACDGDLEQMASQLQVSRRALNRRVKELGLGAAERWPRAKN